MRYPTARDLAGRQAGFTLLEVAVYISLLLILGAPLASIAITSADSLVANDTVNKVRERNRAAMVTIAATIRGGIAGTAAVTNFKRTLQVTSAAGFNGVTVVPGPIIEYRLVPSAGETINGVDDDKDGLVDDGELVRANLSTGETYAVAGMVDLGVFGFEVAGEGVAITLGSFGKYADGKSTFAVQYRLTTYPRN